MWRQSWIDTGTPLRGYISRLLWNYLQRCHIILKPLFFCFHKRAKTLFISYLYIQNMPKMCSWHLCVSKEIRILVLWYTIYYRIYYIDYIGIFPAEVLRETTSKGLLGRNHGLMVGSVILLADIGLVLGGERYCWHGDTWYLSPVIKNGTRSVTVDMPRKAKVWTGLSCGPSPSFGRYWLSRGSSQERPTNLRWMNTITSSSWKVTGSDTLWKANSQHSLQCSLLYFFDELEQHGWVDVLLTILGRNVQAVAGTPPRYCHWWAQSRRALSLHLYVPTLWKGGNN